MTVVEIIYNGNNKIERVTATGHANYSEGEDIVCASVSTLWQTALLGLLKVVNLDIEYEIDDGYLTFEIPQDLSYEEDQKVEVILQTLREGLLDIESGYKKFVKMEEKYNVY